MKQKLLLGILGTGGFGREVMPIAKSAMECISKKNDNSAYEIVFVDSNPQQKLINNINVLSIDEFFEINCDSRYFNIAIGDSRVRESLAYDMLKKGAEPFSLKAENATIYDGNKIEIGSILCANSIITSNAKIGRFFHSNLSSYVAHDCVIGDFVTFAPHVKCNGNVHIHKHAYIGTGAVIKQGSFDNPLIIGEGAIVGMGAVVTKNVAPNTTVIGNPAKLFAK
tara:strand:+ start:191 stop:862 length:672 start_codon:yes stop_codon:yes gene_type:complete